MTVEAAVSPRFSVVVCTRNPRRDYFTRVLAAVAAQDGDDSREIIVVDSNSTPKLAERSIAWPEGVRIVRLEQPGIARARVAGVRAAAGEWVVFIDDDNVPDVDYLKRAAEVIEGHPAIRLFCGRISGEFECTPPPWLADFYRQLAIVDVAADTWAAEWDPARVPCWTAGMCARRDVLLAYCDDLESDPFALGLTRVEDVHLVMRTVAKGHTAGVFRSLHMRHLIPPDRMTVRYVRRIVFDTAYNMTVLRCRDAGATLRDIFRPVKHAALATLKHGWSPKASIMRSAARGDLYGALATWSRVGDGRKRPPTGYRHPGSEHEQDASPPEMTTP